MDFALINTSKVIGKRRKLCSRSCSPKNHPMDLYWLC